MKSVKLQKTQNTQEGVDESQTTTQEYIEKIAEDFAFDDCFTQGPWVSAVDFVHNNGGL